MGDKRPFPAMLWPDPDQGTLNSWTGDRVQDLEPDLHVVRNEDLLSDAPGQVIELVDFLGLDVTPQAVRLPLHLLNRCGQKRNRGCEMRKVQKDLGSLVRQAPINGGAN